MGKSSLSCLDCPGLQSGEDPSLRRFMVSRDRRMPIKDLMKNVRQLLDENYKLVWVHSTLIMCAHFQRQPGKNFVQIPSVNNHVSIIPAISIYSA